MNTYASLQYPELIRGHFSDKPGFEMQLAIPVWKKNIDCREIILRGPSLHTTQQIKAVNFTEAVLHSLRLLLHVPNQKNVQRLQVPFSLEIKKGGGAGGRDLKEG